MTNSTFSKFGQLTIEERLVGEAIQKLEEDTKKLKSLLLPDAKREHLSNELGRLQKQREHIRKWFGSYRGQFVSYLLLGLPALALVPSSTLSLLPIIAGACGIVANILAGKVLLARNERKKDSLRKQLQDDRYARKTIAADREHLQNAIRRGLEARKKDVYLLPAEGTNASKAQQSVNKLKISNILSGHHFRTAASHIENEIRRSVADEAANNAAKRVGEKLGLPAKVVPFAPPPVDQEKVADVMKRYKIKLTGKTPKKIWQQTQRVVRMARKIADYPAPKA